MAQYDITLRDYWRILRRRKGIVMFTAILVGFFSFVMAQQWKDTPKYKASAKVQLNSNQSAESMYMEYMSSYGVGGDQMQTEESVITSFPVLQIVAERLGKLEALKSLNRPPTEEDTTKVVLALESKIDTDQDGASDIITIEVTDSSAEAAKDLANAVAKAYEDYDLMVKKRQASSQDRFIKKHLKDKRALLREAEEAVRDYREQEDLVSLTSLSSVLLGQITNGERQVHFLEQNLKDISTLRTAMEISTDFSEEIIQGANRLQVGDSFMNLTSQLNNLSLQRNALLVKFTENHPQVLQLQAQIDKVKTNLLNDLKQRYDTQGRELGVERERLQKAQSEYNKLPAKGLELTRLEREAEMAQQVLMQVEEQNQQIMITSESIVGDVVVLQRAITPTEPTNPHSPYERAMMGVLLGSIIGIVFAVIAETMDTSIGTIEDVQEYTGTQVVGIVPFLNVDDVRASLRRRGVEEPDERAMERKAQLVAFFDPQSSLAENYRTLRTNIEFVTVEKGAKCLMVTSSMHSEGKSTTISNLAMTMAQLGKQTLLVDCDLRRPSLPRLFGLDKEPGLTEVIVGNYEWRNVIRTVTDIVTGGMGMEDILQTQGISNLHILTSGSVPPNPAELLNSQRMDEFIKEVREAYDMVLFDSPPLLHVTDAAILGKKVDGAVMVYKAGDVPRTSLKRSTSLLTSVNIELFGVVLNGIRSDISSDFQDMSYYGYYAYGSDMETPSRTFSERIEDYVRSLKKKVGLDTPSPEGGPGEPSDDENDEDFDDEFVDEDDDPGRDSAPEGGALTTSRSSAMGHGNGRSRARIGSLLLLPFLLMLIWQSGYFDRILGLIPLAGEKVEYEVTEYQGNGPDESRTGEPADTENQEAGSVGMAPSPAPGATEAAGEGAIARAAQGHGTRPQSSGAAKLADRSTDSRTRRPAQTRGREPEISRSAVATTPVGFTIGAEPAAGGEFFSVRVASYPPDSKWAVEHLTRLRESDEPAFLLPVLVQQTPWERLLVGSFTSWEESFRYGQELKKEGLAADFVVLQLPYAIELDRFPSIELAREAVALRAEAGRGQYWQQLPDGSARVLAGAFETGEDASAHMVAFAGEADAAIVTR